MMMTIASSTILAQQGSGGSGGVLILVWIAVIVLIVAGLWKTFIKAGQPGWAAIVPFYNLYIMTKIVGRPWWWMLLYFIPIVSLIIAIVMAVDMAKSFGKGLLFGIGLALLAPIFYLILGFGNATYQGPAAA